MATHYNAFLKQYYRKEPCNNPDFPKVQLSRDLNGCKVSKTASTVVDQNYNCTTQELIRSRKCTLCHDAPKYVDRSSSNVVAKAKLRAMKKIID